MTEERKKQIDRQYKYAVRDATEDETNDLWRRYLKIFFDEKDTKNRPDHRIFLSVRERARKGGTLVDVDYLNGRINANLYASRIKAECGDVYVAWLRNYDIARINTDTLVHKQIEQDATVEALEAFERVDVNNKYILCRALAKTWHRLVELIHGEYDLPGVQTMRRHLEEESKGETDALDDGDFTTRMPQRKRAYWIAQIS